MLTLTVSEKYTARTIVPVSALEKGYAFSGRYSGDSNGPKNIMILRQAEEPCSIGENDGPQPALALVFQSTTVWYLHEIPWNSKVEIFNTFQAKLVFSQV